MSKKSRKTRAKFRAGQQATRVEEVRHPEPVRVEAVPKGVRSVSQFASSTLPQTARYQHIAPELIRIAIIAGVLFLIIIILSFIIK